MDEKIIPKERKHFTHAEKHMIIHELLSTNITKTAIWKKYTGQQQEHGHITRWMKNLGYDARNIVRKANIVTDLYPMKQRKRKADNPENASEESKETLQLKQRIAELERQLKEAELKATAFSTMVDIAEKEFKIPIRKKLNTKP